jgi:hypothetical protein
MEELIPTWKTRVNPRQTATIRVYASLYRQALRERPFDLLQQWLIEEITTPLLDKTSLCHA